MSFLNNINGKNAETKKKIIAFCTNNDYSIAELSKEMNASIPTITKLVGELIDEGFLVDMGKSGMSGGRRPSIFGLNPSAGYLVGVDVGRHSTSLAITNFKGQLIDYKANISFYLESKMESFLQLASLIKEFIEDNGIKAEEVITCGVNLVGRVNPKAGYTFAYFISEYQSITDILSDSLGFSVTIDNDSRAMTYGEYLHGVVTNEKNVLFINLTWGLGMGMVLDGKLYEGKSGFAGEIGHFPMLENDEICNCGKVGCLETGASGYAASNYIKSKLAEGKSSVLSAKYNNMETITTEDVLYALNQEDVLAIEAVEEVGFILGKAIAGLINLFNPELIVIGGKLAVAQDYLMLPIMTAVNKFSLNFVNKDTCIKFSKLGDMSGVLGACLLSRSKVLGLAE